jgi:hypothetical protein
MGLYLIMDSSRFTQLYAQLGIGTPKKNAKIEQFADAV